MGRELGPENPQARETGSANGQVQRKHSWGGAKVFIMLGLQLQTELMDGAAPVPINSLSLPPSTPALQPSMFSATTAPTVSIEIWVGGQGGKGEEKRGSYMQEETGGKWKVVRENSLCLTTSHCCHRAAHTLQTHVLCPLGLSEKPVTPFSV